MSQRKVMSLVESVANIAIGFGINLAAQLLIFPRFGIDIDMGSNIGIGLSFTGISLTRSYVIRRLFNKQRKQND